MRAADFLSNPIVWRDIDVSLLLYWHGIVVAIGKLTGYASTIQHAIIVERRAVSGSQSRTATDQAHLGMPIARFVPWRPVFATLGRSFKEQLPVIDIVLLGIPAQTRHGVSLGELCPETT